MLSLNRLFPLFLFVWMSQPARQLRRAVTVTCVFVALIATAPWANAQDQFGEVHFPVSCDAGVQKEFDLAVAMLHAFSFPAAAKTFEAISREDPGCAMPYWGIAATAVGSLYGGRPGPMALQGGIALQKAKAIGGKTPREQDYILSLDAFYGGAGQVDYTTSVRAYANALEQLHKNYPEDHEAEIFYAYALSALGSPTDQTFAYQLKGAAILEKLLGELPNHPGVIHYLLHAYDNSVYANRGLAAARRLAKGAPSSPHLIQFPAHIFVRLGLWQDSIDTNRAGAAVDDLFFKPHAMDFLVHSYLQTGQDAAAKRVVDEAATTKVVPHILDAYAMAAMPARYAIERRRWSEAASLVLPHSEFAWNLYPHAEATLVFGRALGAARSGRIDAATKDLDRLQELRANLIDANSEGSWQEYWVTQIQIHHQMVAAWIAHTQGRRDEALQLLRAAADREDSTDHPDAAIEVIRLFATRLRAYKQMVEDLSLRTVVARVARLLVDRARGTQALVEESASSSPEYTQDEIAAMVGSVREVVQRALKTLEHAGLIHMARGRIRIIDAEALNGWSEAESTGNLLGVSQAARR